MFKSETIDGKLQNCKRISNPSNEEYNGFYRFYSITKQINEMR